MDVLKLENAQLSSIGFKKAAVQQEAEREKPSKKSVGAFHNNKTLMKLYELMIGVYKNYKVSTATGRDHLFLGLVITCFQ